LDVGGFRDAVFNRPGTRFIGVDRPGFGQSEPNPNGTFLTWPDDLKILADTLKLDRFGVVGVSGGAPYSLAVARAMPQRVIAVGLACPMAPLEAADTRHSRGAQGAQFALRHPVLARIALKRFVTALQRHPDREPLLAPSLSPPDRDLMRDPVARAIVTRSTIAAFDQGPAEIACAAAHLALPWACWLTEVKQKVTIYQGCCDRIVTVPMAQYLLATLPKAELYLCPGEGHLTVSRHFAAQIVAAALGG
jgi:pimeloyl-ACP methyl ester carboxylesterase